MKKLQPIQLYIMAVFFLLGLSCEKKQGGYQQPGASTVPSYVNTPPIVNAGRDQVVTLICNKASLSGTASDSTGTIQGCLWKQISGPVNCTIYPVNGINSSVTIPQSGTYQFELTVFDNFGVTAADTVELIVDPSLTEVIFTDLTWDFYPNDIPNDDLRLTLPSRLDLFCDTTRPIQVWLQLNDSPGWQPVSKNYGVEYSYTIFWNADMRVFGRNSLYGKKASVKIVL